MSAKKATTKPARGTAATEEKSGGFTAEERAAMKEHARRERHTDLLGSDGSCLAQGVEGNMHGTSRGRAILIGLVACFVIGGCASTHTDSSAAEEVRDVERQRLRSLVDVDLATA